MASTAHADTNENKRFPDGFRILQGEREYITYPERSSVRVWPSGEAYYYGGHWHSAVEILLCTKGEIIYETQTRGYHVTEGQILILPPDHYHAMTIPENSYRYLFLFEPDVLNSMRDMPLLSELFTAPIYLSEDPELQKQAAEILLKVADCYQARETMWNMRCNAYFIELFVLICNHQTNMNKTRRSETSTAVDPELMNTVLTYITQNYKEDITLEKVADFTGFSKFYFSRMFNSYTGCSFIDYLNHKRISVADYLLVHTNKPVTEVSTEAGFGSIATFNRVFKSIHGCSPTRFRKIYGDY